MQSAVQVVTCLGAPPATATSQTCHRVLVSRFPEKSTRLPSNDIAGSVVAANPVTSACDVPFCRIMIVAPAGNRSPPCSQAPESYLGVEVYATGTELGRSGDCADTRIQRAQVARARTSKAMAPTRTSRVLPPRRKVCRQWGGG